VDEGAEAVRAGDAAQYIRLFWPWIQQPTACARLFCVQAAAWGVGFAAGGGYGYINIIFMLFI